MTVLLLLVVCLTRFSFLALTPNTFEQIRTLVESREGKILVMRFPYYWFALDPEKVVTSHQRIGEATMLAVTFNEEVLSSSNWKQCASLNPKLENDQLAMLWNDTTWAYYYLFTLDAFGPHFKVYCKNTAT